MKKVTLILLGVSILLVLSGIWIYLMFISTGEPGDVFGDLGISPNDDTQIVVPEQPQDDTTQDNMLGITDTPLQQLTVKPVVGYRYTEQGDGIEKVVFGEEGTGHIYEIDLDSKTEKRVSKTTIPGASQMVFSASGTEAVILSNNSQNKAILGTILSDEERVELRSIPARVTNLKAGQGDEVFFLEEETDRSVGRSLNVVNLEEKVLFTVPFTSTAVSWSNEDYVYPLATNKLPGYLYKASGRGIQSTGIEGYGLSVLAGENYVLISDQQERGYISRFESTSFVNTYPSPLTLLPQKCVYSPVEIEIIYCAAQFNEVDADLPDDWHAGKIQFSDALWKITIPSGEAELVSDLSTESKRTVDVSSIQTTPDGKALLFTNKIDNTLWIYDFTK